MTPAPTPTASTGTGPPLAASVDGRQTRVDHALLRKYGEGDGNALHRDLYGDLEFTLYEQRARAPSRATATLIPHGHGLAFTTRDRPVRTVHGWSAAPVRHGVSVIRSGRRFTLGLVFHDAA